MTEVLHAQADIQAVLLDSSVLIGAERQKMAIGALIADFGDREMFVSAVSVSELYHGVYRARDASVRIRRLAFVEDVLSPMTVLPIDEAVATQHAETWAVLEDAGRMIGMNDLWIAATALVNAVAVVTANYAEFSRVPGLAVIHYGAAHP